MTKDPCDPIQRAGEFHETAVEIVRKHGEVTDKAVDELIRFENYMGMNQPEFPEDKKTDAQKRREIRNFLEETRRLLDKDDYDR